jgi:hypothetical protein
MKKLLFICLMAVAGQSFAQNLTIEDFQFILSTTNVDSIRAILSPKGFATREKQIQMTTSDGDVHNSWLFRSDNSSAEAPAVSIIHQFYNTKVKRTSILFETSNIYFYTQLMNQLPDAGFDYNTAVAVGNDGELVFSSDQNDLVVRITNTVNRYPYQFTFRQTNHERKTKRKVAVAAKPATAPTRAKKVARAYSEQWQ